MTKMMDQVGHPAHDALHKILSVKDFLLFMGIFCALAAAGLLLAVFFGWARDLFPFFLIVAVACFSCLLLSVGMLHIVSGGGACFHASDE